MTILVNNQEENFAIGQYSYCVEITTGTAKLQMKAFGMNDYVDIIESEVTVSTVLNISINSNCLIKAVISDPSTKLVLIGSESSAVTKGGA